MVALGLLAAIFAALGALFWLSRILERRGIIKNYSRGLGRGLFEVETMLRPSKQYVRQAKEEQREVDDDQGDGPPEDEHLPPSTPRSPGKN